MSKPSFDFDDAKRFLSALDPQSKLHTFQTFGDRDKVPGLVRVLHGSFDDFSSELAQLNDRGAGVYVTVNRTNLEGRSTEDITAPRAAFVDFDNVDPPQGAGALPPSVVVQSKRGLHLYWMLEPGESLPEWERLQAALSKKMGSDDSCIDRPRVMRLPGSDHRKGDPFRVELLECHPERRYTIDVIARAYGLDITAPPPKPVRVPKAGGDGPADDYNTRGDWSMLEKHGWVQVGSKGDETHWRRPGKEHGQLSGTTDHEGRTGIFYCFSSAAPPFEPNQGYTRFQVYSLLEHGNNYKEAARALITLGFGSRDTWLKDRIQEEEDARWQGLVADGPPPDVQRRKLEVVSPLEPPGGWRSDEPPPPPDEYAQSDGSHPYEPPPPTDDDAPPGVNKKKGGRKGKGKGKGNGKSDGGKPKPNLKNPEDGLTDFRVSSLKIYTSDPPIYYFELDGVHQVKIKLDELDKPKVFRKRVQAQVHQMRPSVPLDDDEWTFLVKYWLSIGVCVDQPPASRIDDEAREIIRHVIRNLTIGEDRSELDRGRILPHPDANRSADGVFILKQSALAKAIKDESGKDYEGADISAYMTDLKCTYESPRLQGVQVRVWCFTRELDDPEGWNPDDDELMPGEQATLHRVK